MAQNSLQETLSALGLLGSHFGVPGLPATYDYVIVGGGTAGLTVARRLAANPSVTVAVVEAGGLYETDNGNLTQVPADAVYFLEEIPQVRNPLIDWYQFTEPQPGLGGRSIHYASGKTLGGSSARNILWYQRSSNGSYQKWADQVGDDSYDMASLDQYFKKSVQFHPPNSPDRPKNATAAFNPLAFDSLGGPLQVSYPSWANAISSWVEGSLKQLGLSQVPGFTDGNLFGWSYIAETLAPDQVRSTSESSFLREAFVETTNLVVYKSTLAKKILFDKNNSATGVQVDTGGFGYQLAARKEVVLSAGAFRSPQLLMVSGVGPQDALVQHNISVLADRPGVGQNMWDHVLFGPVYAVDLLTHSQLYVNPEFLAQSISDYNQNRKGILTNSGGDFLAFENLPAGSISNSTRADLDQQFGPDWPEIELFLFDSAFVTTPASDGRNYVNSLAGIVAPFSRGNVTIASSDTEDNPIVSPNWLLDARDQEIAVAGFKRARQMFETDAIREIVVGGAEFFPGANVTSDAAILKVVMQTATTVDHAAGTCAMGKETDENAVIDSKARVFGVTGLRVVDASSFPVLPPGHPQGTIYALAEKIADIILHDN
ncbi:MAG: versicolorin b synthase [Lasallia pustulata]|uniref:Versicolorin b synthase n=1 Tax=Lasallia pustulata TaxID=136370 RepID=A0A5M8PRZ8_9LECA|nr:MAG: versicolorin b synthase [Lasallia pustulata]